MGFYTTFEQLCNKKGVTPAQVRGELGISQSTMASWKSRGLTPKYDTVQKLADYFGVSVDYLLGKTDFPFPDMTGKTERYEPWTQTDEAILKKLEGLSEKDKQLVLAMLDRLRQTGEECAGVTTSKGTYYLYNFSDETQTAPQRPASASEVTDTTPPKSPPETPPEGE